MKTLPIICICSIALATGALGQSPTVTPSPSAALASPSPTSPSISPVPTVSPSPTAGDEMERAIEKKIKKHLHVMAGGPSLDSDHFGADAGDLMAIPIVGIVFTTLFGAPVLIVAVIMIANYLRARSLHRTVRMMVEKGQPVPPALFGPPPAQRLRSDLRRGVVLVMVGLGIGGFLAATDWGGASWCLGLIPFLIGVGYLIVWKLEGKKNDNPPPVP